MNLKNIVQRCAKWSITLESIEDTKHHQTAPYRGFFLRRVYCEYTFLPLPFSKMLNLKGIFILIGTTE